MSARSKCCMLLSFFVLHLTFVQAEVSRKLSVFDIPKLISAYNRPLEQAKLDTEIAEHEKSIAFSRYLPSLDFSSTFTHLNDPIEIDIAPQTISRDIFGGLLNVAIDVDPPAFRIQDQDYWNTNLTLKMPFYAGGRISAGYDAANARIEETEALYQKTRDDQITEALIRYFQVLAASEVKVTLLDLKQNLLQLKKISETLVQTGVLPRFSLYQIEVALADIQAKVEEAQSKESLTQFALKSVLAIPHSQPIQLTSAMIALPLPKDLDAMMAQANHKRLEYQVLEAKAKQVDAQKAAKTGEMLPTVFGFGRYEIYQEQLTALQPEWAVGVGVNLPLLAAFSQLPERYKAEKTALKIEAARMQALSDIPLQVESFYSECASAHAELTSIREGLNASKEALRLATIRYKAGKGSSMEIISAANDLEKMNINQTKTLEKFNQNLIRLYWSTGNVIDYLENYRNRRLDT